MSIIINGDVDPGTSYLGESIYITGLSTNASLVAGVAPLSLTKYYTTYSIQTESVINITLPSSANVGLGWYTRIDLITNTGSGQINILNNLSTQIARLNGNSGAQQRSSVTLTLITTTTYSVLYSMPLFGAARRMPILTNAGVLVRSSVLANFFSYCDVSTGVVINANTTTSTPLRWINPNGQFIDSTYYSVVANTRITYAQTGAYKFTGIIGINNAGGASLTNLRIRPRLNGVTFLTSFSVVTGTILPFATGTYMFDGIFSVTAGDYIEITVDKSVVSGGTNPVDLVNTCMRIELAGSG